MKSITLLIILCSFSLFAQNTTSSSDYDQITLDGKTAYINVKTGVITSQRPSSMTSNSSTALPVSSTTATTSTTPSMSNNSANIHRVAKGETLYSISKKYGLSIAQLKSLNPNMDINTLSIDQVIKINKSTIAVDAVSTSVESQSSTYTVEKGDTLYAISRRFNISVSDLKSKNNLSSNVLSIGQNLIVN